jgi:hypothetical protein
LYCRLKIEDWPQISNRQSQSSIRNHKNPQSPIRNPQ